MLGHTHDILHHELQGFDVFKYTDIRFNFFGEKSREIVFKLVFCKQNEFCNSILKQFCGDELKSPIISAVSFYNVKAEDNDQCNSLFEKPPDAPNLSASEALYVYHTLVDIILRIADYESIDILTFQAYSEKLRRVYDRLVKKYAKSKNLQVHAEGAFYVIWTRKKYDGH
ncbi:hypothetical protein ASE93_12350 [Serratia sp. Leaf50]|uniref:hypothetical protein n=1 Tax=Rouxiella sp. S1S-2 TaxID=2653856 RepID=UPI0006FBF023|nr:hypothetical protein [Rouxiella sp. S1S-2]KAB7896003.1 hypothetical protein GA565_08390 [Rouxiella sp. S1S-2]KQN46895.1 hypothetical protein ASE93_12350 [Serratia sp. Leaf50]